LQIAEEMHNIANRHTAGANADCEL
jgi:hypothetical protein